MISLGLKLLVCYIITERHIYMLILAPGTFHRAKTVVKIINHQTYIHHIDMGLYKLYTNQALLSPKPFFSSALEVVVRMIAFFLFCDHK